MKKSLILSFILAASSCFAANTNLPTVGSLTNLVKSILNNTQFNTGILPITLTNPPIVTITGYIPQANGRATNLAVAQVLMVESISFPTNILIGTNSLNTGLSSILIGKTSTNTAAYVVLLGNNASVSGNSSIAIGPYTKVDAASGSAVGNGAEVNGAYGSAVGASAIAKGQYGTAIGNLSLSSNMFSTAVGSLAQALASGSTAVGQGAKATYINSTAIGTGTTTIRDNEIRLGTVDSHVQIPGKLYFADNTAGFEAFEEILYCTFPTFNVSGALQVEHSFVLSNPGPPASATAMGTQGQIAWDSNYIYVCISANTWKRVAISSW